MKRSMLLTAAFLTAVLLLGTSPMLAQEIAQPSPSDEPIVAENCGGCYQDAYRSSCGVLGLGRGNGLLGLRGNGRLLGRGYGYGGWYVGVEAMFLNRTRADNIKIVENQNAAGSPGFRETMLTTHDLDFDDAWGPRLTVGRYLDECRAWEFTYYGPMHWRSTVVMTPTEMPANLTFPFHTFNGDQMYDMYGNVVDVSNFDGAEDVTITYESDLNNYELNYLFKYGCCCPVTWLIGFRYVDLDEFFDYESSDTSSPGPSYQTSNYWINTENDLLGLQIGGLLDGCITECFTWRFDARAGIYANFTEQHTWMAETNNTVLYRDFITEDEEAAFVTDMRLEGRYHLTNCTALTLGYQLMWVDGVALAPEQLDFTTTPTSGSALNADGTIFYHGAYFGFLITR